MGRGFVIAILAIVAGWSISCSPAHPTVKTTSSDEDMVMNSKLRELASLPDGIEVVHSPNPVGAVEDGHPATQYKYRWIYRTTLKSKRGAITIEEFGCFAYHNESWTFSNFTGAPFSSQDFAEWYSCADAKLLPGASFSDPSNWTGSNELQAGRMKWYFIGVDEDGRRIKGEGIIHTLARLEG